MHFLLFLHALFFAIHAAAAFSQPQSHIRNWRENAKWWPINVHKHDSSCCFEVKWCPWWCHDQVHFTKSTFAICVAGRQRAQATEQRLEVIQYFLASIVFEITEALSNRNCWKFELSAQICNLLFAILCHVNVTITYWPKIRIKNFEFIDQFLVCIWWKSFLQVGGQWLKKNWLLLIATAFVVAGLKATSLHVPTATALPASATCKPSFSFMLRKIRISRTISWFARTIDIILLKWFR